MMLKSRFITFIGTLAIAGASYAALVKSSPTICPSISAIKSERVSMAHELKPKVFFTYQLSPYDTEQNWYFAIGYFDADTDKLALVDANKILDKLTGSPMPEYDKEGFWICTYDIGTEHAAIAYHSDTMMAHFQLRRFLHKKI